jgi:hypothetical protein
MLIGF